MNERVPFNTLNMIWWIFIIINDELMKSSLMKFDGYLPHKLTFDHLRDCGEHLTDGRLTITPI